MGAGRTRRRAVSFDVSDDDGCLVAVVVVVVVKRGGGDMAISIHVLCTRVVLRHISPEIDGFVVNWCVYDEVTVYGAVPSHSSDYPVVFYYIPASRCRGGHLSI